MPESATQPQHGLYDPETINRESSRWIRAEAMLDDQRIDAGMNMDGHLFTDLEEVAERGLDRATKDASKPVHVAW